MRLIMIGFALLLVVVLGDAARIAQAQPYCAMYSDGTKDCGIPTMQSCQFSVRGAGGYCQLDDSPPLPPNLIDRWRAEQSGQSLQPMPPPTADSQPGGLNWMPPPPAQ